MNEIIICPAGPHYMLLGIYKEIWVLVCLFGRNNNFEIKY